jgi:hypothetical protein
MRCAGEAAAAPHWNVRSTAAVLQRLSTGRQHRPVPAGPAPRADMVLVRVGARWSSAHRVKINTCARHACMRKCARCSCAARVRAFAHTRFSARAHVPLLLLARACTARTCTARARAWVLRPGGRWRKVWFLRERAQDPLDDWLCTVPAPLRSSWHTGPRLRSFIRVLLSRECCRGGRADLGGLHCWACGCAQSVAFASVPCLLRPMLPRAVRSCGCFFVPSSPHCVAPVTRCVDVQVRRRAALWASAALYRRHLLTHQYSFDRSASAVNSCRQCAQR